MLLCQAANTKNPSLGWRIRRFWNSSNWKNIPPILPIHEIAHKDLCSLNLNHNLRAKACDISDIQQTFKPISSTRKQQFFHLVQWTLLGPLIAPQKILEKIYSIS